MNYREEIKRMAREAGLQHIPIDLDYPVIGKAIERFAELVAAHEREACIEKCKPYGLTGECVAIAIRARSKK